MYALLIQLWLQITVHYSCNFFSWKRGNSKTIQMKILEWNKENWRNMKGGICCFLYSFQKNWVIILLVAGSEKLYFRWSLHSFYIIICIVWEAIKWVSFLNDQVAHGYTIIKNFLALIVQNLLSFESLLSAMTAKFAVIDYYNGFHWSPFWKPFRNENLHQYITGESLHPWRNV